MNEWRDDVPLLFSPFFSRRERSRDEGHPTCDEEDSAATSISDDAMIDDEIADQPGLVMLGQSASVPASPLRAWRSELFQYHLAGSRDYVPSYYDVVHSAQHSEEDPNSDSATSATSPGRFVSLFPLHRAGLDEDGRWDFAGA